MNNVTKLKNNIQSGRLKAAAVASSFVVPFMYFDQALASSNVNLKGGVKTMVGYVTTIVLGVGLIYALIAVLNWIAAIKQEDPERQTKSIINVFIAGALCLVKPIAKAILKAMNVSGANEVFGGNSW